MGAVAAGLLVSPAFAQTSYDTWNGLPDRFKVDAGYFNIDSNVILRLNGPEGASGEVDFENDLGLDEGDHTFWLEGTWRIAPRHKVKLSFTRLSRERSGKTLEREFIWDGETYNAGLTASSSNGSDILGAYYRFALVHNDRYEIGPTIGVGYLSLDAGIRATGIINGQTRTLDKSGSTGSITGAVGGYADAWVTEKLAVHGDFLYIKISPGDDEASVTDWRLAADYYFYRSIGLGVQYKYNQYSYDRGILASKLGGEITYQGPQVYLSYLF
jgi:hypothetical protein